MKRRDKVSFGYRFDSRRSYGWKLIVALLIIVVMGGGCSNSERTNRNGKTANLNSNITSISPLPSPVATQTPAVDALETPEAQARISKGEQLYKRIASNTKLPVMFGWRAQKMSLLIPINSWNKMSKDDRINLTYYAENLVREIRRDPVPYARRWTAYYKQGGQVAEGMEYNGLYESSYIKQVENLCNTCWDITIGTVKQGEFYEESVPVKGATVQAFR